MEKIIKLLTFFILIIGINCDCPFVPYPRRTIVGFLQAQINNDPNLHGNQNQYEYPLSQQLAESGINIAIGVSGLEFNANSQVDFNIQSSPSTSLTSLKFRVRVLSAINGWRLLRFNFFATQSYMFQVSTQTTNQFSTGLDNTKYAIYRPIPNFGNIQADPTIRIFLSGVSMKARSLDDQYSQMLTQYQSFKKFSTNGVLVRYFSEALEIKKSLQVRIIQPKILGRLYTFVIETNCDIQSISFSYIIFSRRIVTQMHNYITDTFSFQINSDQYKFSSLLNMDMTFSGFTGIKILRQNLYTFTLGLNNLGGQSFFTMSTNSKYLDPLITYLALQMKNNFVCQDCNNSPLIYQNKLCVQQCPRSYSVNEGNGAKYCDKCDIDKLKIVDSQSGLCVCAKRHFLDSTVDTCTPCNYDCMTCQKIGRCLTCDNNLLQTKRTMSAQGRCKCPVIGYYDDRNNQDIVCQKCDAKCLTCSGPLPHNCLTCQTTRQRDNHGFCVCKNGFIEDYANNCVCPPPRTLTQTGVCLDLSSPCGPDKIQQFIDLTRRCVCKPGFISVLDKCIKCNQFAIFNENIMKCQCLKPAIQINGQCQNCDANSYKVYDQTNKICVCQDGTFQAGDGSCIKCPLKMIYNTQSQICQCAFNYYEESVGVCKRCKRETDGPKCKRNLY